MNVLLVSPLPPPAGGIASWTKGFLESKRASENHIRVVNEAVIGKRIQDFNRLHYLEEWKRSRKILSNLMRELSENSIDLVHLNSSCGRFGIIRDYLCVRIVKRKGIKMITHFHCDISYKVDGKFKLFIFKRVVLLSDTVLTLNEGSRQFVLNHCGKASVNLPNFLSDEFIGLALSEKVIEDRISNILFVGHVEEAKGCDVILETAKSFPEIQFTLLGFIDDKIKKLGKPDNVFLLGEVSKERVKSEMMKADLFLFPSHTEGFPTVILEAMAFGLPIISTPVGAIPDMIEDAGGVLVPVNDAAAAKKAILFLQDRDLREKMSHWNKQKVVSDYRSDKILDRLFELYHH